MLRTVAYLSNDLVSATLYLTLLLLALQAAPSKAASTSSGPAFNRRLAPQTGSGALKQAAEQGLGTAAAPAAPAGSGPVVAFVGGKSMKESDRKLLPVDAKEVRRWPSISVRRTC